MYAHKYQYITIRKHTQYCYNECSSVLVVIITTLNFWSQHMDYSTEIFSCYFYSLLQQNDPTSGKCSSWPWKSVTSELGHMSLKVWMIWKLEIIWSFTQDLWQLRRTNMLQTHKNFVSNVSGARRQIGEKGHCWRNIFHPLPRQVRNFILGRLNVLSKPDSLNIDVQAPPQRKSPSTSILNLLNITSTSRKWKFWTGRPAGLREGSRRRFTSGPTNQHLTRTRANTNFQIPMTQFWCHWLPRSRTTFPRSWVILLKKAVEVTAENFR